MMKYSLAIFDLDGTLTDSEEGIIKSFLYVCEKYGIKKTPEELYKYIGPPIFDIFADILETDDREEISRAVATFRERYEKVGYLENRVYDGVFEALTRLRRGGVKLAIATSKPEYYANKILSHFKLTEYFDFIRGASMDGKISKKPDLISNVVSNFAGLNAVMIGDRFYDLQGAAEVGIDAIGVRYGYAPLGELEKYPNVFIADTPQDIADFILNSR